jgi:putative transposase
MSPNRALRFPDFNYIGFSRYFLTICVYPRRPVFHDLDAGRWVSAQLLHTSKRFDFEIPAYCVMPDHLHVLAEGTAKDADLRRFVSRWKQLTGYDWKRRTGQTLWQKGYFDHVLRDEESDLRVIKYIVSNPVRAGLVDSPQDYPLTGSSRYTFTELAHGIADWEPFDGHRRRYADDRPD